MRPGIDALKRCCCPYALFTSVTHLSARVVMAGSMQAHGGQGGGVSPAGPWHKGQTGQSISRAAAWWAVSGSSLPSALILQRPGSCSGVTHVIWPEAWSSLCQTTDACRPL